MSRHGKQITAVLFDWDLTLAYTLEANLSHLERVAVLFQHQGIDYSIEEFRHARNSLLRDVALGRVDGPIKPQTKEEIIWFYQQLLTLLGHHDTGEALAYQIYISYARLPTTLYQDVLPALASLQRHQVKAGILSNHSQSVRTVIEKLVGLYIPGRHITISEEIGVHKPNPAIFAHAAATVAADPAQCIYIGDNLDIDAVGAVKKGHFGLGLWLDRPNQGSVQDIPENVNRITTLSEIFEYLPVLH